MHKLIILVTAAWLVSCGCATAISGDDRKEILSSQNSNKFSSSYEKRKQIFDKWIGSMGSDNIAIANIAEILRNVLYMAEPVSSPEGCDLGIMVLEDTGENKFIPVVAVLPGDEDIGPDWEFKIGSFWGLLFIPDYPLVIIRDDKVSDFWREIIMIYQGSHIASYLLGSSDYTEDPASQIVVGEYCAYKLIVDVLDQKGGQKYQEILNEKVSFIKNQFRESGNYLSPDFSDEEKLNNAFTEAPLSPGEIHVRWKILWMHSTFKAIESLNANLDKKSREKIKIDYLFSLLSK